MVAAHDIEVGRPLKLAGAFPGCLALFLKSTDIESDYPCDSEEWHVLDAPSVYLQHSPQEVFQRLIEANKRCSWFPQLYGALSSLKLMGAMFSSTFVLFIHAKNYELDIVRECWVRRLLRPPSGFTITRMGEVCPFEIMLVPQSHFIPLHDVLCICIQNLTDQDKLTDQVGIMQNLKEYYHGTEMPSTEMLSHALSRLIKERKIYHTAEGYFLTTPDYHKSFYTHKPLFDTKDLIHRHSSAEIALRHLDVTFRPNSHRQSRLSDTTTTDRPLTVVEPSSESDVPQTCVQSLSRMFRRAKTKRNSAAATESQNKENAKASFSAQFPPGDLFPHADIEVGRPPGKTDVPDHVTQRRVKLPSRHTRFVAYLSDDCGVAKCPIRTPEWAKEARRRHHKRHGRRKHRRTRCTPPPIVPEEEGLLPTSDVIQVEEEDEEDAIEPLKLVVNLPEPTRDSGNSTGGTIPSHL